MDTSRVSFGEMVAAAGGVALLVLMFLPWFGGRLSGIGAPVRVPTRTGWESFGTLPEFLIIVAIALAVGIAVARAMNALPPLPVEQGLMVLAAGAVTFLIVGFRLLDPPDVLDVAIPNIDVDSSRKIAAFLALGAAGVIAYGGFLQRRERPSTSSVDSGGR
jgi:hypothetical protein